MNDTAPEYRYILKKHPQTLEQIPPEISDKNLEIELHEIHHELETKLRLEVDNLIREEDGTSERGMGTNFHEANGKY